MRNLTLVASFSIVAAGCAGDRTPFVPADLPPKAAAIYLYRPAQMTGRLQNPTISLDGKDIGKLEPHKYTVLLVPEGKYELRSRWKGIPGSIRDDSASLFAEAGKSYYYLVRFHERKEKKVVSGLGMLDKLSFEDKGGLYEVPEKDAVPQLAGIKPSDGFKPVNLVP